MASQKIKDIKHDLQRSSLEAATAVLDRLERDDPESCVKLVRRRTDFNP